MAYNQDYDGYAGGGGSDPSGTSSSQNDVLSNQIQLLYQQFLGRQASPNEIQDWINGSNGGNYTIIRNGIQNSAEAKAYSAKQAAPPTAPATGDSGNTGGSLGSLVAPFTGQFNAPAPVNLGGPAGIPYIPPTPVFTPPSYTPPPAFSYAPFKGPDAQSVLNDPGYQFRLNQGEQALQQGAAAKGTLNGGATQKAILGYGQDYASNEFNNVWNRDLTEYNTNLNTALTAYNTNYGTQYLDPYKFAYQGAVDAFAPQMTGYQTQAAAGQHQTDMDYSNAWNQYLEEYNRFRDQRDSTFNKQFQVATS